MIRNIVFDMGNVLIDYTPAVYAQRFAEDDLDAVLLEREIFLGPEWAMLDEGTIGFNEALNRIRTRLPQHLDAAAGEILFHWHERIVSVDSMTDLVRRLKRNHYRVFLLSNANTAFDAYKESLPFYPLLDGILVSAFEKLVKPDPAIYRLLAKRYGLIPEESVFIDDALVNVEGAIACGFRGHCFADRDQNALERALAEMGVKVR